jgi:Flp pilus assembly protein TadD
MEVLLGGVIDFHANQNRLHGLIPVLTTLASEHPSHGPFLSALGVICIKLGNLHRAIEIYSRLNRLVPENRSVSRTLAGLHVSLGDKAQAMKFLQS